MGNNIQAQGCNPNTIQKAYDRVRKECDHFDSAVGLMAETCVYDHPRNAGCVLPGLNIDKLNIPIQLFFEADYDEDGDFDVVITCKDTDSFYYDWLDGFTQVYLDTDVHEGNMVEVVVYDNNTQEILASKSTSFTFHRPGYWGAPRRINIEDDFDFFNQQFFFDIDFVGW